MPWKRPGDADSGRDRQSNNVNFGMNGFNLGKYFNGAKTSFFLILLAVFAVWFISGFYTVKESDRGVVLRFGKFVRIVEPGLNWKPTFIDKVYNVNITAVQSFTSTGLMLTQDENVVKVEMNVQFRISDAKKYLFSVTNPQESLKQASDSALRFVVGHTTMDDVLTKGRQKVKQDTWEELQNMGLTIVDVNMLPARAPDQVKDAFDDAIAAQEDEQRYIREAEAYAREVRPKAVGRVQRLNEEAEAYRQKVVLAAEGEVARFKAILPEYNNAPTLTKKRIYLETMEEIYSKNNKVILDVPNGGNSMIYLPIDKMINNESATANKK